MLKITRFGSARAHSLRAFPISQLLVVGVLALGIGAMGHYLRPSDSATASDTPKTIEYTAIQALADARAHVGAVVGPAINVRPESATRQVELDDGQSFAELLSDSGVSEADALAAMSALGKAYDLRHLQAGQEITLSFLRTAQRETFIGAVFQPEATKEITVARTAQSGFIANVKMIPVVRQRLVAQGEIHSSLYEASDRAHVPHAVMAALVRIYSHDIDFQRDIHPGDRFEIFYEQPMTAQGKAVGEGNIIYASMTVGNKAKPVYRVTFSDNTVDYFDESGQSTRRAILRTPVAAARITSGFGMRMHPLLGYSKMHKGVDFGAAIGTPIFAAGNGVIEDIGFKNGYGRYVRIRHNGSLATAYAHMSRFGANMHQGARVNQGEVIGYVGMSGRATGPHLHFEVHVNGQQVNPMSVNLPSGRKLEGKLLAEFKKGQIHMRQEFEALVAKSGSTSGSVIQASTLSRVFGTKSAASCGLRGGC